MGKTKFIALMLLPVFLGVCLTSCSSDKDDEPDGSTTSVGVGIPRHLMKITLSYNSSDYHSFTYDNQNRITSYYRGEDKVNVSYTDSKITFRGGTDFECGVNGDKVVNYADGYTEFTFVYAQDRLTDISGEVYNGDYSPREDFKEYLSWDTNGNLVRYNNVRKMSSTNTISSTTTYTYMGGDKAKISILALLSDDFGPLYLETPDDFIFVGLMGYLGDMTTQYPTKAVFDDSKVKKTYTYEYTFDEQGYPLIVTITEEAENLTSGRHVSTITYEWE